MGGGTSGRGGRAGTTSGGDGGTDTNLGGGGGTGITFGAHCDCDFDELGSFDCTMSLESFASRVEIPSDCSHDENYVRVRSYTDGRTGHEWQEGFENDYRLVFNGDTFEYGEAFGYVGSLCDIDVEDADHGSITAGRAGDAQVHAQCRVCGDPEMPIDEICPSCTPVGDREYGPVTEPLENYCTREICPPTVADARARLTRECRSLSTRLEPILRTGCGVIQVMDTCGGTCLALYVYDAESGALVGAAHGSDTPRGLCRAFEYRGGFIPPDDCGKTEDCHFCEVPEDGAGGVAGSEPCPPT